MQEVTAEAILGTIIGHLNVEKARLIAENARLAVQVQRLTLDLATVKAEAEKPAKLPVAASVANGSEATASVEAW